MDYDKLISSRLGGASFYNNSYYKFEKYANYKKKWLENNPNTFLLDFGIGEQDTLPSSHVLSRLGNELWKYENRVYSDNGIDMFLQVAAIHMLEVYKVKIKDPLKQINHCMGAKSALCILPLLFVDEKDIVINTIPGYDVCANMAKWMKGSIYNVELKSENNYLVDLDNIDEETYRKCKLFIINYPNNPTGGMATLSFYQKLVAKAIEYNFLIINDATYGVFTYDCVPLSIFNVKDAFKCAIEIHSFSKTFAMSGMRIGFVVSNSHLIDLFKKCKDNIDSGQYIPIQYAAIEAILNETKYINKIKSKYLNRLKNVASILNNNGLKCEVPKCGYYLYVKVPNNFQTGEQLARFLLNEAGIFAIPYDDVGHFIRLSMTFKIKSSEKDFYNELENRLKKLH